MKKLSIFIVLILLLGALFYFLPKNNTINTGKNTNSKDNIEDSDFEMLVSYHFSEDDIQEFDYHFKQPASLDQIVAYHCLKNEWECNSENYGEMGILITQIKGKQNGEDQKYWQYFIEDEQPQISVDKYYPKEGDTIEWKFIKSEF